MADSAVARPVAVLIHIPEATGSDGLGPAPAYIHVRTSLREHCRALVGEVRTWLKHGGFRTMVGG